MSRTTTSSKLLRLPVLKKVPVLLLIIAAISAIALVGMMSKSGTRNDSAVTQRIEKDSNSIPAPDPRPEQPTQELSVGQPEQTLEGSSNTTDGRAASDITQTPDRRCRSELRRIQSAYNTNLRKEQQQLSERLGYPIVGSDIQTYYIQQHNDTATGLYEKYAEEARQEGCGWQEDPPAPFTIEDLNP